MRKTARLIYANAHWLVIPIALLLLFATPFRWLGFLGALALCLFRWLGLGSPVPVSGINRPLLIFLGMVAVGFAVSPAPELALVTASQVIASVSIFFVLLDYRRAGRPVWQIAGGLVVFGVAIALVAPFTVQWSASKLFGLPAFYDQLWPHLPEASNPNIFAGALAPIVPIALAMIVQARRPWRTLGAIALVPILLMLILLQSRGAIFGLAVGMVVWLVLYNRWFLPLIPLGLLTFLGLSVYVGNTSFAGLVFGEKTVSLFQRQDLWTSAITLISRSPLTGIGLNAFPRIVPGAPDHAHNLFLQIALDTGFVGLAAFVGIWWMAIQSAWRGYRARMERHLAIGVLASFVVLLSHGLGDVVVWGTAKSSVVLWILLALALGLGDET